MTTEIEPVKEELRDFMKKYIRSLEIINENGLGDNDIMIGNTEIVIRDAQKLRDEDKRELSLLGWFFDETGKELVFPV